MSGARTIKHLVLVTLVALGIGFASMPEGTLADRPQRAAQDQTAAEPRIIGGTVVPQGKYPFIVFLIFQNAAGKRWACSGSIVESNTVVTAAHCTIGAVAATALVNNANRDDLTAGKTYGVSWVYTHPWYNPMNPAFGNDVGLVRLSEPVPDITPIKLLPINSVRFQAADTPLVAAGWGRVSNEVYTASRQLMEVTLPVVDKESCRSTFGIDPFAISAMVCAGANETGVCNGDSGGPLFQKIGLSYVLIGITSFGTARGCGIPGYPDVFGRVAAPSIHSFITMGPAALEAVIAMDPMNMSVSQMERLRGPKMPKMRPHRP